MSLLELHMLGTDPLNGCECCLSSLTPEGRKNNRRNTSALLQVKPANKHSRHGNQHEFDAHKAAHANGHSFDGDQDDDTKTILIDCGKSFLTSALEWFPKKGFRKIDALLITHPHSDAMSGLDDLRGWTLGGAIQETMDIYVNRSTFKEIERTYPYLVSKEMATGGGDVPAMNYIIFDDQKPFDICGVTVTPLPVHHGWYFTRKEPYYCLGFLFNQSIAYISDVSFIPESTWALLTNTDDTPALQAHEEVHGSQKNPRSVAKDAKQSLSDGAQSRSATQVDSARQTSGMKPPPVLVIDCLRVYPHTSHFGFAQAIATARRVKAKRNFMLGFAHRVTHATWEKIAYAVEKGERPRHPPKFRQGGLQSDASKLSFGAFSKHMRHSDDADELKEIALEVLEEWEGGPQDPIWIRPTFDGHTIFVDETTGECWDDEYATQRV